MIPAQQTTTQQNGTAYNPAADQWHEPGTEYQQPMHTFQAALVDPDPFLSFLVRHPHMIKHMFGQLAAMLEPLYAAGRYQVRKWKEMFSQDIGELTQMEAAMNGQQIVESLHLDSDNFFALISDHAIADVQAAHAHNHQMAVTHGYAHANHPDPQQATAYMSPWGVSSYNPQSGYPQSNPNGYTYQPHPQGQDPYAQPYYPNQPVGGYGNPYGQQQGGTMTGAAMGLGMQWLAGR